jgi:hypothetical protein
MYETTSTTHSQTTAIATDEIDWPTVATNPKELSEWLDSSDVDISDPEDVETTVELLTVGYDELIGLHGMSEDALGSDDEAYLSPEEKSAYWDAAWSLRNAADDLKERANSTDPISE